MFAQVDIGTKRIRGRVRLGIVHRNRRGWAATNWSSEVRTTTIIVPPSVIGCHWAREHQLYNIRAGDIAQCREALDERLRNLRNWLLSCRGLVPSVGCTLFPGRSCVRQLSDSGMLRCHWMRGIERRKRRHGKVLQTYGGFISMPME